MDRLLVIVSLLLLFFVGVIVVAAGYGLGSVLCAQSLRDSGHPYRYKLLAGCQVQDRGRWIPVENWRVL